MPDWVGFVRARLDLGTLQRARQERIVRELAAQLEDFYRDAIDRGAAPDEAEAHAAAQVTDWARLARDLAVVDRHQARPRLDRVTDRLEDFEQRRRGGFTVFSDTVRDIRHAVRQLAQSPGFTLVAVLTLALGIGATSAMFSVVNGVLLRPLPYAQPDRLVRVHEVVPQYGRFSVAPATFLDWREQNTVFSGLGAYSGDSVTLATSEGPERIESAMVTADVLEVLGVKPFLGRLFRADEDVPDTSMVVVLSYGAWQRRFGGDPGVVGRQVTINGAPATVIGVMPSGFYFPSRQVELWRPLGLDRADASRGGHFLGAIARLKPGIEEARARAEIAGISERLAREYPDASANESAEVVALHEQVTGRIRPALLTLLAAVLVVVLIACANVANLLLVRASVRAKELAIRAALGARRGRLLVQLLTESLVLAAAGGGLGLLLACWVIGPLQRLSAGAIPRVEDVAIDWRVLAFSAAVSLATGVFFGLVPAWQASRADLQQVLREGGRSSASGGGRWLRSGLLVCEVGLSLVLLVGAALLLRSFYRLTSVDPGFQPDRALAFRVALPNVTYPEDHDRTAFYDRLLTRLEQMPGIRSAGMVQTLPLRGGYVLSFAIRGRAPARPGEEPSANYRSVSPHFFASLGVNLQRGRVFTGNDRSGSPLVAVVDQAFASRYFPNEDPIGQGIDIGNGTDGFYEIVGVVGNVRYEDLEAAPDPTMYVPFAQNPFSTMWLVARTDGDPALLAGAARDAVRELDPALPAFSMAPLSSIVSEAVAQRRFSMLLLGLFALTALFLAAVGLYGVVAYGVSQRTQEIGLRMAMGADRTDVLRLIVGGGMRLAVVGVAAGLAVALLVARVIASMLYELTPFDPVSYAATAVVLLAVAALACFVPARRAMQVDPIVALRQE
jgi:putative ABC transport system permease protein